MPSSSAASLRVVIQQPALPHYRVPFFAALDRRPGIDLLVVHHELPGLPTADADGFRSQMIPARRLVLPGRAALWHGPQLTYADRRLTDVLVLGWNLNCASLVPALLRARRRGVATVLWGHGYSKSEAGWRRAMRQRVARLATAVLFYNHRAARQFVDDGWDTRRVHVAPNALDQTPIRAAREQWLADPSALEAFRREHRLDPGPNLLFVSRLEPANRLDRLLQAAASLSGDHPHLQLLIVGKGNQERQRLEGLAGELGITQRVRFLGAIYGERELAPWFLNADLFCYPANVGLSLLHAFGYGLPVVTCDRLEAQNPEIEALRHGENGLLYRDGDADDLAGALRRLIEDQPLRRDMGAAALRTVHEVYNVDAMVDGMEGAVRFAADVTKRRRDEAAT